MKTIFHVVHAKLLSQTTLEHTKQQQEGRKKQTNNFSEKHIPEKQKTKNCLRVYKQYTYFAYHTNKTNGYKCFSTFKRNVRFFRKIKIGEPKRTPFELLKNSIVVFVEPKKGFFKKIEQDFFKKK